MRFLIVPNYGHPYDQRMVRGLAEGLHQIGHQARALPAPIADVEIVEMCRSLGVDVLMQVNRFRPTDPPLASKVKHIAWFQDIFPDTIDYAVEQFQESDIVYTLGDSGVLGLDMRLPCHVGCLVTGVDEATLRLNTGPVGKVIDFSLCGFIPPPVSMTPSFVGDLLWSLDALLTGVPLIGKYNAFWIMRRILFRKHIPVDFVPYAVLVSLRETVEELYRPLYGELDIRLLSSTMRDRAGLIAGTRPSLARRNRSGLGTPARPDSRGFRLRQTGLVRRALDYFVMAVTRAPEESSATDGVINYFAREYPRLLDRVALVQEILRVSNSVELYGPGWNRHEQFKPYHKGVLDRLEDLLNVYRRTRINLANNTHGFGLHSRTLECMAIGGFIFMHASPHDAKPGGMHTSFEPGVHYGMFTPENLQEEARRWLKDEKRRIEIGQRAAAVVHEKHLWRHRAQQIIDDLRR